MKSKQEISDEEIQRFMNFDKLLSERQKLVEHQKRVRNIIMLGSASLVVIISLSVFLMLKDQPGNETDGTPDKIVTMAQAKKADSTVAKSLPVDESKQNDEDDAGDKGAIISKAEHNQSNKRSIARQSMPDEDEVLDDDHLEFAKTPDNGSVSQTKIVYQQAEPVNGYPDLYAYFDNELKYPAAAVKDSVQGVVTVVFTVNAAGKAEDVKIENSLGQPFDEEVIRVLENMPLWKPAYYNGKLVKSKVSLPLTFQLKKVSSKK